MSRRRAVFLDRDGTLIEDVGYLRSPEQLLWVPGAGPALRAFQRAGYAIVVLTNQSGVARGYYSEDSVRLVNERIRDQALERWGVEIDRFYFCPHHPDGSIGPYAIDCTCRKPAVGMFEDAIADLYIDPGRSIAVGDNVRDLVPARQVGVSRLFLSHITGAAHNASHQRYAHAPDWDDILEALRTKDLI